MLLHAQRFAELMGRLSHPLMPMAQGKVVTPGVLQRTGDGYPPRQAYGCYSSIPRMSAAVREPEANSPSSKTLPNNAALAALSAMTFSSMVFLATSR